MRCTYLITRQRSPFSLTVAAAIKGEKETETFGCRRQRRLLKVSHQILIDEYVDVVVHGPVQKNILVAVPDNYVDMSV